MQLNEIILFSWEEKENALKMFLKWFPVLNSWEILAPTYKSFFAEFMLVKLVNVHLLYIVSMNYSMVVIADAACRLHRPKIHSAWMDPSFSVLDVVRHRQGTHTAPLITFTYLTFCNQCIRAGVSSPVVVIKQAVGNEAAFWMQCLTLSADEDFTFWTHFPRVRLPQRTYFLPRWLQLFGTFPV